MSDYFCQILTHGLRAWVVNILPQSQSWESQLFGPSLNTRRTRSPLSAKNLTKLGSAFFLKASNNKAEELSTVTRIKSPINSERWNFLNCALKDFFLKFLTWKICVGRLPWQTTSYLALIVIETRLFRCCPCYISRVTPVNCRFYLF